MSNDDRPGPHESDCARRQFSEVLALFEHVEEPALASVGLDIAA